MTLGEIINLLEEEVNGNIEVLGPARKRRCQLSYSRGSWQMDGLAAMTYTLFPATTVSERTGHLERVAGTYSLSLSALHPTESSTRRYPWLNPKSPEATVSNGSEL